MSVSVRTITLLLMAMAIALPGRGSAAENRAKTKSPVRSVAAEIPASEAEEASAEELGEEEVGEPLLIQPRVSAPAAKAAAPKLAAKPAATPAANPAAAKVAVTRPARAEHVAPATTAVAKPAPQRKSTAASPVAARSQVVRAVNTSEPIPAPRSSTPTRSTTTSRSVTSAPEVIYDPPEYQDQQRVLNPSYHPARVKRYATGWHKIGSQPAGPGGEMVPSPEPMYQQGGDFEGGEVYEGGGFNGGAPSMGEYVYNGNRGNYYGGGGGGGVGRKWSIIAGGEMMWIRPRFSQAGAIGRTSFTQSGPNQQFFQTLENFDPGYQGGFRAYIGARDCCCGDEFRLTFFNLTAVDSMNCMATNTESCCDFLCNETPNPGDSVSTDFRLNASVWDIECIRPFFFNPSCNDCCGPSCPVWDLRWFAGLRFAYINHYINSVVTDANSSDGLLADAHAANKFTGIGPRVGLQGRKYFGQSGRLSVYGRGSGALLVGANSQLVQNTSHGGTGLGETTNTLYTSNARMIPAAEIELGATVWVLPRFAVSAGWNLQAYWDLGLQETGSAVNPVLDDSNILGFDSVFLRGEMVF